MSRLAVVFANITIDDINLFAKQLKYCKWIKRRCRGRRGSASGCLLPVFLLTASKSSKNLSFFNPQAGLLRPVISF